MSVTFQYAGPPLVNDISEYHTTTSRLTVCIHTTCQATVVPKIIPFPDSDSKSENCTVTSKTCIVRFKDNRLYSLTSTMCCPRISKYYLLTVVYPNVYLSREYPVVSRKFIMTSDFYPKIPTYSLNLFSSAYWEKVCPHKCSRKKDSSPFRACGCVERFYNTTEIPSERTTVPRCF